MLMLKIGADGEACSKDREVTDVMAALAIIDGGHYQKDWPGRSAGAESIARHTKAMEEMAETLNSPTPPDSGEK